MYISPLHHASWFIQSFIIPTNANKLHVKTLKYTQRYVTSAPTCSGLE